MYDDMYMENDPVYSHKAWKAKIDVKKAHRKKDNYDTSSTSATSSEGTSDKRQLKLSNKLQASMITDLKLSKGKVDCLMTA